MSMGTPKCHFFDRFRSHEKKWKKIFSANLVKFSACRQLLLCFFMKHKKNFFFFCVKCSMGANKMHFILVSLVLGLIRTLKKDSCLSKRAESTEACQTFEFSEIPRNKLLKISSGCFLWLNQDWLHTHNWWYEISAIFRLIFLK